MKKIFIVLLLVCSTIAYSQMSLSHGATATVDLSKDYVLTDFYGDTPEELALDGFRFGYTAELTSPITQELYWGGTATAALGFSSRYFTRLEQTLEDPLFNYQDNDTSAGEKFLNSLELNIKAAPLIGYKYAPFRSPFFTTIGLAPITVATDFGASVGEAESTSIYLGSGIELGYYWTQGRQDDFRGIILGFDFKWNNINNTGSGFKRLEDYWGLDISFSFRKEEKF